MWGRSDWELIQAAHASEGTSPDGREASHEATCHITRPSLWQAGGEGADVPLLCAGWLDHPVFAVDQTAGKLSCPNLEGTPDTGADAARGYGYILYSM